MMRLEMSRNQKINLNKFRGCFFGLVVGDTLGMPYEFKKADNIDYTPEYKAGGPFKLPKGCWTDDTTMMLCLADSLIAKKGFDPQDQLLKYLCWYRDGYNSAIGGCFDIGNQTEKSLLAFERDVHKRIADPTDRAGNGALMRLSPIPLVYAGHPNLLTYAEASTVTTHNNKDCIEASKNFSTVVADVLLGCGKEQVPLPHKLNDEPTGYVIDSYLLALDAFHKTDSFMGCMEYVIKQGGDTDTNACIAGMLAGAYYGFAEIPEELITGLIDSNDFFVICDALYSLRDEVMEEV